MGKHTAANPPTKHPTAKQNHLKRADTPLTEKQLAFVMNLVHHKMTQTAAARHAGSKDAANDGYEYMKHPKILAAIAREREEYARASQITKAKVIDGFKEAIDMARMVSDPHAMIAGWREIGRMCGLYEATKTKVEVSVNGQVMIQKLQSMTDEELLALVDQSPSGSIEGSFSVVETEVEGDDTPTETAD